MFKIKIERVNEINTGIVNGLRNLLPQLSPSVPNPTDEALKTIIGSKNTFLHIVRNPQNPRNIIASLTLFIYPLLSGRRARLEDVVVDEAFRRKGIGEQLMRFALQEAARKGVNKVELTSHPKRKAANRLYQKLGFKQRKTNVYVFDAGKNTPERT